MTFVPGVYKIRQGGVWVRGVPKKKVGGSFELIAGPKVKQAPSFTPFVAFSTSFEEAGAANDTTDLTGNHTITFGDGAERRSTLPKFGSRSLDTNAGFFTGFAQAASSPDFDLADNQDHTISIYFRLAGLNGITRLMSNGVFELRYNQTGDNIEFEVETNSGTVTIIGSGGFGASQTHALVTFDAASGTIRLGYEGNIDATAAWDGTFAGTPGALLIGGDGNVYLDAPEVIQGWAYTKSDTTYTVPTQLLKDIFEAI